ncbi:MAG: hypothetical protein IKT00_11910 [Prevotella sp.]|nr:hypothetical protein [Prevotella sp.]
MNEKKKNIDIDEERYEAYLPGEEQHTEDAASYPGEQENDLASFKQTIEEHAREDEDEQSSNLTLRKILGGDILTADLLRRQIWLILLIVAFIIVYVANRYSCQKSMLEINRLNKELVDTKYKMLSLSSVLTERCRESHVMMLLRENNDTTLHTSDQPPYIIDTSN